ncbi:hypothetical protein [Paenibacillus sp. KR2-11]|uniref:phage tail protein n=1 Tax=Paenibacillus sp. KR2-11 TaxID=3385500 RepID=UPI0038FC3F27
MAETIKGINVVIGSETTGLSAALSDVNKKSREIQSELKQVEKLLKLDPENTELLAQKQKLLSEAVANTREKLDRLKTAQEQVNEQFAKGEISEAQYRAFQREIAKTEQELKNLETQGKKTGSTFEEVGKDVESASEKIRSVGEGLKGVGERMSAGITAPLAGIAALTTEGTKELREDLAKLDTNAEAAGASIDGTREALRKLNAVNGETDSNVEGLSNLLAANFKGGGMTEVLESLTGAIIKFPDTLNIEGLSDGLQETLATGKGVGMFGELLERMGVNLENFDAGLKAANESGTQQQYILDTLAKTGLSKVNDLYRKNNEELVANANANFDLQMALSQLGAVLTPVLTTITEKIAELVGWFTGLDSGTQQMIVMFASLAAVIGPIVMVIGSLVTAVSGIVTAFTAASGAIAAAGGAIAILTGPIGVTIGIVTALAAAAYLIYKNWEPIKTFFSELWTGITETMTTAWEGIKAFFATWGPTILAVISPFIGIPLLISQHWEQISGFFRELWDGIVSYLGGVWGQIQSAAVSGFQSMVNMVKPIMDGFQTFFTGAWEAIRLVFAGSLLLLTDLVTGDFESLSTDAQNIWEKLKEALGKIWDGIREVFTTALDLLQSGLAAAWEGIATAATAAWEGIKKAVLEVVEATVKWIRETWDGLVNWFRELPETLYKIGSDMFTRMKDSIIETVGQVKEAIVNGMTEAVDWVKALPDQMLQIGKDIIQGLVDGITSMASKVREKVAEIVNSIPEQIRSMLGIHSPSRVLMQLGEYAGDGLALGLQNSLSSIRRQASAMAAASVPGIVGGAAGGGITAGGTAAGGRGGDVNQYITINSPSPLSPAETARKNLQASRQLAMEWGLR